MDCKPKPPCPKGIDLRSQSEWLPGKNCKLVKAEALPFCPDKSDGEGINVRQNEDLIPGVTCLPLPDCPQGIDFRSQSKWLPGKNCKLFKEKSIPECPQGIDFRSQSEWVPGKNCKLVEAETATTERNIFIPPPSKPILEPAEPAPETTAKPADLPPKERWRLKATRDQIRLVDSVREKGTNDS